MDNGKYGSIKPIKMWSVYAAPVSDDYNPPPPNRQQLQDSSPVVNVKQYDDTANSKWVFYNGDEGKVYHKAMELPQAQEAFEKAQRLPGQDHVITSGTKPPNEKGEKHKYRVSIRSEPMFTMKREDTEPNKSGRAVIGTHQDVERALQNAQQRDLNYNKSAAACSRSGY